MSLTWSRPDPGTGRFRLLLLTLAVSVAGLTAAGIGVRATYGAHTTADEPQYLLSALSLWEDGDLDIADELAAGVYRDFHEAPLPQQTMEQAGGRRISPHGPLLPLLLAAPVGLWGWIGGKVFLAAMAGGLAALTVWVAHRRLGVRPSTAFTTVGILSLAPPLAIYATQIYPELSAALIVTAAVALLTGRPSVRSTSLVGGLVVALPWLAVKFVPVAAVLALILLWWAPRPARGWIVAGLAVSAVAFVAVNLAIYGGMTPYASGDHFAGGEFAAVGVAPDLWGRASRLVGLLVDRGFGLAAWQPAYLLLPVAGMFLLTRRAPASRLLMGVVATGWVVATFVALTMHGWWFPGRQLVVVLPVAVLALACWADGSRARLVVIASLGSIGVGAFGSLLAEGVAGRLTWVVDFASTGYLPYRVYSSLLPDYMANSPATWIRHGAWLIVLAGLLVAGYQSARAPLGSRGVVLERERHAI